MFKKTGIKNLYPLIMFKKKLCFFSFDEHITFFKKGNKFLEEL